MVGKVYTRPMSMLVDGKCPVESTYELEIFFKAVTNLASRIFPQFFRQVSCGKARSPLLQESKGNWQRPVYDMN